MNKMVTIQVGQFPGKLDTYVVAEGTTVDEVLKMANLTAGQETAIEVDGEPATLTTKVDEYTRLVVLSKRIKGAF